MSSQPAAEGGTPRADPRWLVFDPYLCIPYWNGGYPKHPSAQRWPDLVMYHVASASMNVGTARKPPFKPIVIVITRKSMIILKASDLTLCRRISLDSVGEIFSNIFAPPAVQKGPTGFIILKLVAGTSSPSSGGAIDGDIAFQDSRASLSSLLEVLVKLTRLAKGMSMEEFLEAEKTFTGALPGHLRGGIALDLARGDEGSLQDTKVEFKPVPQRRDLKLAFSRLDSLFVSRRSVADRFLAESQGNPNMLAVFEAACATMNPDGTKKAPGPPPPPPPVVVPPCGTVMEIRSTTCTPPDFLSYVPLNSSTLAALMSFYAPVETVAALWVGRVALHPDISSTSPLGDAPKQEPLIVASFLTRRMMYFVANGYDVIASVPISTIRHMLITEKMSRRRTQSMFQRNPSAADAAFEESVVRVKCVMLYAHLTPPQSLPTQPTSSFVQGFHWESSSLTVEFASQSNAMECFRILKSLNTEWTVDQLQDASPTDATTQVTDAMGTLAAHTRSLPSPPQDQIRWPLYVESWCPSWRRNADIERIAFRARMYLYYERYCPWKLPNVDKIVFDRWDVGPDEVLSTLSKKYGPEVEGSLQDIVFSLVDVVNSKGRVDSNQQATTASSQLALSTRDAPGPSYTAHFPASSATQVEGAAAAGRNTNSNDLGSSFANQSAFGNATLPPALQGSFGGSKNPLGIIDVMSMPSKTVSFRSDAPVYAAGSQRLTQGKLQSLDAPTTPGPSPSQVAVGAVASALRRSPPTQTPNRERSPGDDRMTFQSSTGHSIAAAAASGTGPPKGTSIGDVLRSYGFSVTFFDRFAAMYFPPHSGIDSKCEEPQRVLMMDRLIRSYAPDEDSFYAALIQRSSERQRPVLQQSTYSTMPTSPISNASSQMVFASSPASPPPSAASFDDYEPAERSKHVNPSLAWNRSPNSTEGNAFPLDPDTAARRFHTMSRYTPGVRTAATTTPTRNVGATASNVYHIAESDLQAMMLEPLTSSTRIGGHNIHQPQQSTSFLGESFSMSPPVFSGRKPEGYLAKRTSRY